MNELEHQRNPRTASMVLFALSDIVGSVPTFIIDSASESRKDKSETATIVALFNHDCFFIHRRVHFEFDRQIDVKFRLAIAGSFNHFPFWPLENDFKEFRL